MSKSEHLRIVRRVRREHGIIFADSWLRVSRMVGAMTEACDDARIIQWPDSDEQRLTDAQARYLRIQREIADRTFDAIREAIVTAFVQAATEVLARERKRQVGR